ncbi:capsular biosynthesis protein [Sulfitobacter sp. D35]|uniref:capsule biosynthesis protein n=1 Tax=Sulfitobacter sp. D35 TaxID=3083252 RepID=UPI00296E641D|nr:capsular biosynthesis protein [Sulfitobacter sp. D35]MDW4497006.1 capsular biosynthesis protein [Sulfitobacter sp. D35]
MPQDPRRVFLFLQGPHGPFFYRLGQMLRTAGAEVWRVGFNAGDRAFWFDRDSYLPFTGTLDMWGDALARLLEDKRVTDVVLYGDTRPIHTEAVRLARARGLTVHVFEEGYMRPYWITYERGGSNGNSRLMQMPLAQIRAHLPPERSEPALPPGTWGDMREHIFYGALYHGFVMFRNRHYRNFTPHRALPASAEFRHYLRRLLGMPAHALERHRATRAVRNGGYPYHLALLQLAHDSAVVCHSPFASQTEFVRLVIEGFVRGAPAHHHLVFKAHPLEDGRTEARRAIRRIAAEHGVAAHVHYIRGGKLARLLDEARSAVTINSTAGQQALWRGIPLKAFGAAVYAHPGLVSGQPLDAFFRDPAPPDGRAYRDFRRYLLSTSQVAGGFYSARARRMLLRRIVDMVLCAQDPYDAIAQATEAPRQQVRLVS